MERRGEDLAPIEEYNEPLTVEVIAQNYDSRDKLSKKMQEMADLLDSYHYQVQWSEHKLKQADMYYERLLLYRNHLQRYVSKEKTELQNVQQNLPSNAKHLFQTVTEIMPKSTPEELPPLQIPKEKPEVHKNNQLAPMPQEQDGAVSLLCTKIIPEPASTRQSHGDVADERRKCSRGKSPRIGSKPNENNVQPSTLPKTKTVPDSESCSIKGNEPKKLIVKFDTEFPTILDNV